MIRDGLFSTLLSLFCCYLLSLLFFNTSFFNPLSKALHDFSFLDVYYAERLNENSKINQDIILINVEHKSRYELGLVLQRLLKANPKVIGFDVILKEFNKTVEDTLLAKQLNNRKVIGSTIITQEQEVSNHPFFRFVNPPGFVNFNFDGGIAVIREFESNIQKFKNTHQSFASAIARRYLSDKKWKKQNLNQKLQGSNVINYQGNLTSFFHFTTDDLMDLEDISFVTDKIVLLGYLGTPTNNAHDVEDKHFTPLNKITAGKSIPDMYGLVIHANIIAMILNNGFMYEVPRIWLLILTFIFSFLASIYFIWLSKRLKISYRTVRKAVLFIFAICLVWLTLILFKKGIVLKSAPIIAVTVFSAGFIKFYKHLVGWVNTKIKFRSYLK
ncbi:CHASE2 domain-containing protein [Maribacter confluentis]|uniref:CHASE2 domain-containing protein n=1 Tax=Maribacter confluentis TaxID=1656093 RepID=A0ABT8RQ64_9FLAO|nr:CHASE2 domain-containing protein [Maribacter confluentis]MDO1513065.1 CHASE2 domain-containing protein [Maribacter confluentis]